MPTISDSIVIPAGTSVSLLEGTIYQQAGRRGARVRLYAVQDGASGVQIDGRAGVVTAIDRARCQVFTAGLGPNRNEHEVSQFAADPLDPLQIVATNLDPLNPANFRFICDIAL